MGVLMVNLEFCHHRRANPNAGLAARGFTLIELMIAVVIVGILASLAYPAYTNHMIQTRRAEAQANLVQLAGLEEKFLSNCGTYTTTLHPPGAVTGCGSLGVPAETLSKYYNFAAVAAAAGATPTFTLTATAIGSQTSDKCGNLTLDQLGVKGRSGTEPIDNCWRR